MSRKRSLRSGALLVMIALACALQLTFAQPTANALESWRLLNERVQTAVAEGRYEFSLEAANMSLEFAETNFGPNDVRTISSLNNLARIYQRFEQPGEAAMIYRDALQRSRAGLGEEHTLTETIADSLEQLEQDSAQDREPTMPATAPAARQADVDAPNRLIEIAQDMERRNLPILAEAYYRRALTLSEQTNGETHPLSRRINHDLNQLLGIDTAAIDASETPPPSPAAERIDEAAAEGVTESTATPARTVRSFTADAASPVVTVTNRYGPVQVNETLSTVAEQMLPEPRVPLAHMMLAIVERNPDAFIRGNINGLRLGTYLEVPTADQIEAWRQRPAATLIAEHHRAWAAKRAVATPAVAQTAAPSPSARPDPEVTRSDSASLRLEPTLAEAPREAPVVVAGDNPRVREIVERLTTQQTVISRNEETLDALHSRLTVFGAEIQRLNTQLEDYQRRILQNQTVVSAALASATERAEPQPEVTDNTLYWALGGMVGGLGLAGFGVFVYSLGRSHGSSDDSF